MKLKPRPQYLSKLVAAQDNSLIKVITGMRRCGKSSLLTLFRQHLLQQGIAEDHIIMMNLESFQYSSFTFEDLHNAIADRMQQDDHYYLLLDEVQLVDKWERAVNALHTDADVDITITGSNAYLLSSQLATLLSGRYMEINVFPLSFAEFMAYADLTDENAAFERYTRYGGLPPVVNQGTDQNLAYTVLSGIYDTILVRDISQFLQVRNPLVFNDVARYLADTAGSPVSTSKIENRLRSAHRPASNETIERYISGLLNAFLFYNAQRINVKGGAYLQGLAKYYPADLGIRNMLLGYSIEDFGFLLENAVHNELKIRGYQIRVGKIGKAEIDFVATRKHADLTEEKLYNMIVPFQMVMFTLSKLADMMGLNTPWGLWIVYLGFGAGLAVFIFTGVVKGIPSELEESAMIDGASVPRIFFQIVLPIMRPSLISVAILQTMWIWNDFLLPYLTLDMRRFKTMSIAIQYLKGGYGSVDMGAMMACLVVAIVPIIIFYLCCQKYIIKGVMAGAVKG